MTIDDDRSIYIGGLPYNASEDTLRRVFNLYGSIVAVKVINSSVLTSNSTINKAKKIKIKVNFSFATKITSEVDGSEL
jgi:RNA recognition motif-containing protein